MLTKFKLTPMERAWVLYDVGNSAFVLLTATLFPVYFNALAGQAGLSSVEYLSYWGYANAVVTLLVAVCAPLLGSLADIRGFKKPSFQVCVLLGVALCALLGLMRNWLLFLILFAASKICYSLSLVLYDAMLSDVTQPERMDRVSSYGYGWGYIGSCVPFVMGLALILLGDRLSLRPMTALNLAFLISAVWWLLATLPLLKRYRQQHYVEARSNAVADSLHRLFVTVKSLKNHRQILFFLLAFFCYIDGVYTIIDMATAYGTALGLDTQGLLLALLVMQIVAFPAAILFGRLSERFATTGLIPLCILVYVFIAIFAFFLDSQLKFWVMAMLVGLVQGGIQALSRSHFARIIPPEKSGEYFGIFDICGKGASFLGTILISASSQLSGSTNLGVGLLSVLFLLGLWLFLYSVREGKKDAG